MDPKKKILIVDDEQDVRTYLSRLLQENGYDVCCAGDGNEAWENLRTGKPGLITLDLSMPNKSGVRFYRDVKADPELADIPVVFVTAVAGPGGNPREAERFYTTRHQVPPPDGFVAKPIDPAEMLAIIRRLTSQS